MGLDFISSRIRIGQGHLDTVSASTTAAEISRDSAEGNLRAALTYLNAARQLLNMTNKACDTLSDQLTKSNSNAQTAYDYFDEAGAGGEATGSVRSLLDGCTSVRDELELASKGLVANYERRGAMLGALDLVIGSYETALLPDLVGAKEHLLLGGLRSSLVRQEADAYASDLER